MYAPTQAAEAQAEGGAPVTCSGTCAATNGKNALILSRWGVPLNEIKLNIRGSFLLFPFEEPKFRIVLLIKYFLIKVPITPLSMQVFFDMYLIFDY